MTINLYYVEGISRIDTPSFNTKDSAADITKQENYFLTKLVKSIDTTFYPPHYQNTIKFDQDDLTINDNVNYLSLDYNGKTYYYFIDSIVYTSSGIITLEVSMDTIQTFMFDIFISSAIIERKFINRWTNDNKINRYYKRENLSDGLFVHNSYTEVNHDRSEWFIVTRVVKADLMEPVVYSRCGLDDAVTWYPASISFMPYTNQGFSWNNAFYRTFTEFYIRFQSVQPDVGQSYIIPFNPFYSTDVDLQNHTLGSNINCDIESSMIAGMSPVTVTNQGTKTAGINSKINYYDYHFNFVKNVNKGVVFNYYNVPALFDENYIRLIFGSRSSNTTTSLYLYNTLDIKCCYYADLITGSRFYFISSYYSSPQDNYRTLVADYAPINMDLVSDTWAQYNATNKYRWLEAAGMAGVNALKLFLTVYTSGAFAAADMAAIAATSLTPKRQKISKKGQRAIQAIERSQRNDIPGYFTQGINDLTPLSVTAIKEGNAAFAPDTIKLSNSFDDIASHGCYIFIETQQVNDIVQCANYYHRNGYLVNEYITMEQQIFNTQSNYRYYFDVLKLSIPEVHLHNVIEDEETVNEIENRFITGLRLWHVRNEDVTIGDFTYDNVENDYL